MMGGMWIDERGSVVLGLAECRRLLALGAKQRLPGHLGYVQDGTPIVLPVDYAVDGPDVVLRVGEGLFGHICGKVIAFEVDGTEDRRPWSVLVHGHAEAKEESEVSAHLPVPRVAEPGERIVGVRSESITGRRLAEPAGTEPR